MLSPCHTKPQISTALAWSCLLFFQRAKSQENPDIFRLSPRPYSVFIATIMALLRSLMHGILSEFLLVIHCALTALTMCTLCFHSIHTALRWGVEDAVTSQRMLYSHSAFCDLTVSTGNATALLLAIKLHAPRSSAFFLDAVRTLLWCDRGLIKT